MIRMRMVLVVVAAAFLCSLPFGLGLGIIAKFGAISAGNALILYVCIFGLWLLVWSIEGTR